MRIKKKIMNTIICAAATLAVMFPVVTSEAVDGAKATASVMRLEKTIGDVSVTQSSGKDAKVMAKMRLNSGDDVKSGAQSYAYISLDDNKAVKLDERSDALIKKDNKKLELLLQSGNLLFDVDKALAADESFEIKTSTMTMGIRGTFAQVEKKSENHTAVSLLDGTLSCTVTDPKTGKSQSVLLKAGEYADFYTGDGYPEGIQIIKRKVMLADLKNFSVQYILENRGTAGRILMSSGIDPTNIGPVQEDSQEQSQEHSSGGGSGGGGSDISGNNGRKSPTAEWYSKKQG